MLVAIGREVSVPIVAGIMYDPGPGRWSYFGFGLWILDPNLYNP